MFTKFYEKIKNFIKNNLGFLISIVVILFLFLYQLPYVVYIPGGNTDISDRLVVDDGYDTEGSFNLAYVSMVKCNTIFYLLSYVFPNWDLIELSSVTYQDETLDETIEIDKISLDQSVDYAIYNAYTLAGKTIDVTNMVHHVTTIVSGADTDIEAFDEIISVEGTEVKSLEHLKSLVQEFEAGQKVTVKVKRDDEYLDCYAVIFESGETKYIGITITTTLEYTTDPSIEITKKASESGSSGGLMMTLSVYNQLVEEDITKGRKVVGTGTVDLDGNVGKIGGIKYKLLGSKDADIFLVPVDNYDEAVEINEEYNLGLNIVKVSTVEEAINILKESE